MWCIVYHQTSHIGPDIKTLVEKQLSYYYIILSIKSCAEYYNWDNKNISCCKKVSLDIFENVLYSLA